MYSSPRFIEYGSIPWIGPESTSCRDLCGRDVGAFLGDRLFDEVLVLAAFFELFFFDGFRVAVFLLPEEVFLAAVFLAFFLLARCAAPAFFAAFLVPGFLVAFFLAALRAAGFRLAAVFFFATFRVVDFPLVLLTLRFFPEDFLVTPVLRDARTLVVPARFRFLVEDFLAGIFHSCRSEKNAELYIG